MTVGYLYTPLLNTTAQNSRKAELAITGRTQLFPHGVSSENTLILHLLKGGFFVLFFGGHL